MISLDVPVPIGRRRFAAPRWLVALVCFTALTILFFWPWLSHVSTALIGPPEDNMQDFWNSWHATSAHSWRDFFFTTRIRFPQGTSLHYHSFNYPQVFVIALLAKITGTAFPTLVALQNLTVLATFPLAGAAMFALARHFLKDEPHRDIAAALAGFVFAFNPWHVQQAMHHAHVAGIEFLPLFVLFYLLALERQSWRWLIGAAVMAALSALSCWYFLFYALYFTGFQLLVQRIRDGLWPRGWRLVAPVACFGSAAILLSPWLIPMLGAGNDPSIYYPGSNIFVADLLAYVAFPPTHALARLGSGVYAAMTSNAWEGTVYLGLANLALIAFALTRKSDKRPLYYALGGMAFFAVFASGSMLHVGGVVTRLFLPDAVLSNLPFFANVRTPARAMVFVYLFLGLAVAQAIGMLAHRPTARPLLALAALLVLLDFLPVNLAATPAACPAGLGVVTADPGPDGVLDLPRGYNEDNAAMMLAACHGHPIVGGIISRVVSSALTDRLVTADLAAQKRQLTASHVKYVVLHKPQGGMFRWNRKDGDQSLYFRTYRIVQDSPDMTVLRVY